MKLIRNIVIASTVTLAAGLAMAQTPDRQQQQEQQQAAAPSRAEVLADQAIYRESGLLELERANAADVDPTAYAAARQRYQQLRRSAHYVELVRSNESKTGELVVVSNERYQYLLPLQQ
jgi:hypothetical protein